LTGITLLNVALTAPLFSKLSYQPSHLLYSLIAVFDGEASPPASCDRHLPNTLGPLAAGCSLPKRLHYERPVMRNNRPSIPHIQPAAGPIIEMGLLFELSTPGLVRDNDITI